MSLINVVAVLVYRGEPMTGRRRYCSAVRISACSVHCPFLAGCTQTVKRHRILDRSLAPRDVPAGRVIFGAEITRLGGLPR